MRHLDHPEIYETLRITLKYMRHLESPWNIWDTWNHPEIYETPQWFNHLTSIAWMKVFRITTEFCIFSLLRGNFSKSCKSTRFPLDDVYYRTSVYTLCRVHSSIMSLLKSFQVQRKEPNCESVKTSDYIGCWLTK